MKTYSLKYIFSTILILALGFLVACDASTPAPTVIPTEVSTSTPEATPTHTSTPTKTPLPTKTPNIAATKAMEENTARIQDYVEKGYLPSTKGSLFKLDDYKIELAQVGYLSDITFTSYIESVRDFVFRGDFFWENAAQFPETSGCGFYYRVQPNGDFYSVYLDTERVVMGGYAASQGKYVKRFGVTQGTGRVDFGNPAQANFTLIMNGYMGYVLIDDQFIGSYTLYTEKMLDPGWTGFFVKSGSNKDYGTRCEITNASLWVVEP